MSQLGYQFGKQIIRYLLLYVIHCEPVTRRGYHHKDLGFGGKIHKLFHHLLPVVRKPFLIPNSYDCIVVAKHYYHYIWIGVQSHSVILLLLIWVGAFPHHSGSRVTKVSHLVLIWIYHAT